MLDAASRCFAERGFAKTTVEEIAGAAGVSKGLVYAYFASKDDLLDAVIDRALEEWGTATRVEMEAHAESVLEAIAVMHRSSIAYARRNPVLRAMLQQDARLLLLGRSEIIGRSIETWRRRLCELLARGVASGELRADLDVEHTVDVIRMVQLSFIDRMFMPGTIDVSDDALHAAALDLIRRGIAAQPATAGGLR
jgi:AcrR family transcriptional regulator